MIQKVNSLSSNVYTSHGEILKVFFFFFKYVDLPTRESNYQWQCSLFMLSLQVTYDQVIIVSTAKTSIKNGRKSSTNSQLQIQFKFSQRDLKLKS